MLIIVSRIVLALLGGLGAYQAGASIDLSRWFSDPWRYGAWAAMVVVGALVGWLVGGLLGRWLRDRMRAIDRAADRRSAAELIVGALGLVVGLVAAALAGVAVAPLPIVGIRTRSQAPTVPPRLIDTSAIIDGRIVDVVRTHFLPGALVVPGFVLEELQRVADSTDPIKRARGRRGLELVEELKSTANGGFSVRTTDYPELDGVDAKLVRMAHGIGGAIVTTDFNLNKVARIQGVEVLNLNELANARKPAVLPGEPLTVKVIREGREYDQGVGYLDDGTMVVVEGGRRLVGREAEVEVTSVLQSPSGKMIFTRLPTHAES